MAQQIVLPPIREFDSVQRQTIHQESSHREAGGAPTKKRPLKIRSKKPRPTQSVDNPILIQSTRTSVLREPQPDHRELPEDVMIKPRKKTYLLSTATSQVDPPLKQAPPPVQAQEDDLIQLQQSLQAIRSAKDLIDK